MGSFLILGKPGSGKTTLGCSMTDLGYRVHLIDVDNKAKTMVNLQERVKEEKIIIHEVTPTLSGASLSQIAKKGLKFHPVNQPHGYLEIADLIDGFEQNPPKDAGESVLMLDSMTRVNEHLKRLLKHFSAKPKLDFDGWDAMLNNYEELFQTFFSLQPSPFKHCIVTAHLRDVYDANGNLVEYKPLIDGQFSEKAGGYVEEVYYCDVDAPNKNAPPRFMVYTKPVGYNKHARSSRPLRTWVEADMSVLLSDLAEAQEEDEE